MSYSQETGARSREIADEILRQLGGRQFLTMTGAHNLVALGTFLAFRLPGRGRYNYVQIELTPMDTYDVTFSKWNFNSYEKIRETKLYDVYWDQLVELFEERTGLYTTLYPRKKI